MEDEMKEKELRASFGASASSWNHGTSKSTNDKTTSPHQNVTQHTYRRSTTSSAPPKSTFQDPLASGSNKAAKSVIELTTMASKGIVSGATEYIKNLRPNMDGTNKLVGFDIARNDNYLFTNDDNDMDDDPML